MSRVVFRLPDLGEGLVSAEIVSWHVKPGDRVKEDQPVVEMSTDKAVVEVPASVTGIVVSVGGQPGDNIAVGAELVVFETDLEANVNAPASAAPAAPGASLAANSQTAGQQGARPQGANHQADSSAQRGRVMASPATRRRAREAGIDLGAISGSGPGGRVLATDLQSANVPASVGVGSTAASRPSAAPTIALSHNGVLRTRSFPNSFTKPSVILNAPPYSAISCPIKIRLGCCCMD